MTNNELYSAIFKRRSIRKYDMAPLPSATLEGIQAFTGSLKPIDKDIKYGFAWLGSEDVKNLLPIKAPHYICLYSEKKEGYLMNAGFLLQQIDLYLSANNIASCWLGVAKPAKAVPEYRNGMEFVIMLSFGNSNEPVHRENGKGFIRNSMSQITDISGADELLEPVCLAPSASNSQPWFFSGDNSRLTVSRARLNLLRAPLYGRLNQIDIGIALCHLWLSAEHQGRTIAFDFQKAPAPDGYDFMVGVKLSDSRL